METLRGTRLDRSAAHQGRSQIRSIACSPPPGDVHLVRLNPITFQVLKGSIAGHCELVGERDEFPPLAAGLPAAHHCVTPIEAAAAGDVDIDALIYPRFRERDQRMPIAMQVRAILHQVRTAELRGRAVGRGMDLYGRLRCEPHAGAAPDADDLLQAIVAEYAGSRRGNNHVQALALGKPSPDAEWRLGVYLGQHRAAVAADKTELEAAMPPDQREWPLVAMTHRGPQKSE